MLKTEVEMEQGLKRHLKAVLGGKGKGSVAFVCEKHLKRERESGRKGNWKESPAQGKRFYVPRDLRREETLSQVE